MSIFSPKTRLLAPLQRWLALKWRARRAHVLASLKTSEPGPDVHLLDGSSKEFERTFVIGLYKGSSRRLLLRSDNSEEHPTRIDVRFENTAHVDIPTVMEGLIIDDVTAWEADETAPSEWTTSQAENSRLFRIECTGAVGYVIASACAYIEDRGNYWEPSSFPMDA